MLLAVLLATFSAAAGHSPKCDIRVGELVPNEQVARELANVIIRSRQSEQRRSQYSLRVEKDGATAWLVYQSLPDGRPDANGRIRVTSGGGGLAIRINRCNGAMSAVYYMR